MEVVKNDAKRRFEMPLNGDLAYIEFFQIGDAKIYLTHTKVPDQYQGQGYGSILVEKALDIIGQKGMSVVPHCSFIRNFIKGKPKYRDLLDGSVSLS